MAESQRIALVTGANRGIGLEVAKQLAAGGLHVLFAGRDLKKAQAAAKKLGSDLVTAVQLDIDDEASVQRLASEHPNIDVLVNNAAILLDEGVSALKIESETLRKTLETNVVGAMRVIHAVVPGMAKRGYGRVVNVSSGAGQLSSMTTYAPSYSISKAALNAVTRTVAAATRGRNVLVNSADPGWVRTDMGGRSAPRSVAEGADTIVWLATLPDDGPTGGFFHDRQRMDW